MSRLLELALANVGPVYEARLRSYGPALEKWGYDATTEALTYVPERGAADRPAPPRPPRPPSGRAWVSTFTNPVVKPVGRGVEKAVEEWVRAQVEPEVRSLVIKVAIGSAAAGFVLAWILRGRRK